MDCVERTGSEGRETQPGASDSPNRKSDIDPSFRIGQIHGYSLAAFHHFPRALRSTRA